MKRLPLQGVWVLALVVVLVGVLATIGMSAGDDALPAYLSTAKPLSVGKCKMCHKPIATAWEKTQHAGFKEQLPWEKDPSIKPVKDDIYRHVTGFKSADDAYDEKGISCEACHGPGSAHMPSKEKKATIVNPANLATTTQKLSVCGRCHGQYSIGDKRYVDNFLPGQDITKMAGFKLDEVVPGKKMQQMNEMMQSKHVEKGVVCLTCHSAHLTDAQPHQLRKAITEQCLECHKDKTLAAHAPTAAADATCATCHMPNGTHSFIAPKK